MQNLSDKELDDLFKKASQQYAAAAEKFVANWQDMQARLEATEKAVDFWTGEKLAIILSSVIVGSILLSFFMVKTSALEKKSADTPGIVEQTGSTTASIGQEFSNEKPLTSGGIARFAKEPEPPTLSSYQKIRNISLVSVPQETFSIIAENTNEVIGDDVIRELATIQPTLIVEKDELQPDNVLSENVTQNEIVDQKSKDDRKVNRGLALKVLISPDFSTVGFSSSDKPGWNYGVLAEYYFTKHWSVASGIIRSRKIYSATDAEYNGYNADNVAGDCRMWDIPLNVYYHFSSGNRWSFYSGLGFSSYLMSKEKYVYTVDTYYGPTQYDLEVNGKNNEWFKMLNISIGIEKQIDSHFAFQFEPFLKAPLAGVGEGDVSLASLGAFISLKYQFIKNK